jgi:tetratricopeptide (TPR) repeat protein
MFTKKEKDYRIKACKITKSILYLMDEIQQNLFVEIHSKDTMRSLNPSNIALNLKRQIQKGLELGNFSIDGTEVKWHSLLPFNVEKFGAFGVSLSREPNCIVNTTEVFVNEQGEMKYRNPRVVCFYTDMKFDRINPLVSRFKDALRQVEKYSPSLIYLEVERGTKIQDLQEAEKRITQIFDPSAQSYDERTKGVKYCVFSAIELVEENGMMREYTASRTIENKHSEVSLPQSFFMYGKWFPGNADPKAIINESVRLSEGGKYEEAISYYEFALRLSSYIAEGWNNKGNALNMMKRYPEALKCLDNALKLNPHYASAWMNKGISLANLGYIQEALRCFDKVIELNQNLAQAWYNKGLILFSLGKINESLSCTNSALGINPKYENARKLKEMCEEKVQA